MAANESKRLQKFLQSKNETLGRKDLSLKGSIDEPIRPLVSIINQSSFYYTTSTCSGRITLIEKPFGKSGIKKGNNFLLSSHENVKFDQFNSVIKSFVDSSNVDNDDEERCLWFKFEPFIMHIQCFDLEKARKLLNIVLASGCRNSGITLSKSDKYMLAVRSTSSMEVPLHCGSRFNLEQSYIRFLCDEGNRRMSENEVRLARLQQAIEAIDREEFLA